MGDLRVLVCGGGPAGGVPLLIDAAVARGWRVDVTATANARAFVDSAQIARISGRPVRTDYRYAPDGTLASPPADGLIIAPATYNTINKLALGIADTYPLSSVAEVIGRGVPTVVVPSVNSALAARASFQRAIDTLRGEGVRILFGPDDNWEPRPPRRSVPAPDFPWLAALDELEQLIETRPDAGSPSRRTSGPDAPQSVPRRG